ncbi:MAG: hypothetical protein HY261_02405 [Chloroflexi bacterium]|nr:hypothetical protein [Chloroflexota bacterium]
MTQAKLHQDERLAAAPQWDHKPAPLCHVCGKPVETNLDSACRICNRPVHISWKQGEPESACSRIVSPLNCCGIAFVCNPCADGDVPAQS